MASSSQTVNVYQRLDSFNKTHRATSLKIHETFIQNHLTTLQSIEHIETSIN